MSDYQQLPGNLPVPQADGAAGHLPGAAMPSLVLRDTSGNEVALDQLGPGRAVISLPADRAARRRPAQRLGRDPGRAAAPRRRAAFATTTPISRPPARAPSAPCRFGDLISHQNDRKGFTAIADKVEGA